MSDDTLEDLSPGERLVRTTLRARGRVQGVGFRAYVQRQGRRLGVTGYVRNLEDGSVEVVAEGLKAQLRDLEAVVRRGPGSSRVEGVDLERSPATGEFSGFNIRY